MKVTANNIYSMNTDYSSKLNKSVKKEISNQSFDKVTISDMSNSESKFFNDLTNSILRDIKTPHPIEELNNLSEKMENNLYEIDFNQIVKKMLLC